MKSRLPILSVFAWTMLGNLVNVGGPESRAALAWESKVALPNRAALIKKPALVLRSAITELERHETITARLRFRVDVMGQRLTGSGSYLQGPWRDRRLRLDVNLQAGDLPCSLQQVCDGKQLWIRRQLLDSPSLTRIDVARVLAAGESGQDTGGTEGTLTDMGLGGLPRLLRSLDNAFHFSRVEEGNRGSVRVLLLHGDWRTEMLSRMLPAQAESIAAGNEPDLTQLGPHAPDQVVLCLGRDDLFPYCVEYLRTERSIPNDRNAPYVGAARTLMMLELFEVRINAPVDPLQFIFNPGKLTPSDGTDAYLEALRAAPK